MITNYQQYVTDLKKISKERDILRAQDVKLYNQQTKLQYEFLIKSHEYLQSEFAKKLKPLTQEKFTYFMLNDEVGIKLNKIMKYTDSLDCRVIYHRPYHRIIISKKVLTWSYKDNKNLDQFIDYVITELNKINETREKSKLTRVAKKYNL